MENSSKPANEAKRHFRIVTFGFLPVVALMAVAVSLAWLSPDAETPDPPAYMPVEDSPPADLSGREGTDRTRAENGNRSANAGWEDVNYFCGVLAAPMEHRLSARGGFTAACEAALDRHFLDASASDMPIAGPDGSLTWREVFSSPLQKREKAYEALRTSCPNVGRDCDVAAVAAFGVLKYQCGGRRYGMLRRVSPGIHGVVEGAGLDALADNTVYWRRREEVERAYYRTAWLAAKCAAIPEGVLASFVPEGRTSAFPSNGRRAQPRILDVVPVGHEPAPGQEGWWWAEQAWEAHQIMRYAAAVDQLRGVGRFVSVPYEYGPAKPGSWQHDDPLLAEIVQLKWWKNVPTGDERENRVFHAYLAATWAAAEGVVLDGEWLGGQVGSLVTEDEWEELRTQAERFLEAQGRRVLFTGSNQTITRPTE